jgi:hypothetical protein
MWSIDIPGRKATLFDNTVKWNTATLGQVGRGVTSLLSLPDEKLNSFKNEPLYLRSFLIGQREVLDSAIRATGTTEADWEITKQDPEVAIKASRDAVAAGNPMAFVSELYLKHMLEGYGGNYEEKAAKHAQVLGLKEESLDEVIKRVAQELGVSN